MSLEDFMDSLKKVRRSVTQQSLVFFDKWNQEFGDITVWPLRLSCWASGTWLCLDNNVDNLWELGQQCNVLLSTPNASGRVFPRPLVERFRSCVCVERESTSVNSMAHMVHQTSIVLWEIASKEGIMGSSGCVAMFQPECCWQNRYFEPAGRLASSRDFQIARRKHMQFCSPAQPAIDFGCDHLSFHQEDRIVPPCLVERVRPTRSQKDWQNANQFHPVKLSASECEGLPSILARSLLYLADFDLAFKRALPHLLCLSWNTEKWMLMGQRKFNITSRWTSCRMQG